MIWFSHSWVGVSLVWLGGWWGVDLPLLPRAAELMVAPWKVEGNTTQFVPAEYMKVATRASRKQTRL